MMDKRSAADPWVQGRPPHLPWPGGLDVPPVFLLPGDPARVDLAGQVMNSFRIVGQRREFRIGVGSAHGVQIGVCSTGIGGPSTEIALVELARLGVRTVIRIGGMGALLPDVTPGSLAVVVAAEREGGTARFYSPADVPAVADERVVDALRLSCSDTGRPLLDAQMLTTDSYYIGQGRPLSGLEECAAVRMACVRNRQVTGMDMETETVFAVSASLGLAAGAVLAVHANRATDEWLEDYEPVQRDLVSAACRASAVLEGSPST